MMSGFVTQEGVYIQCEYQCVCVHVCILACEGSGDEGGGGVCVH